MKKLYKVLDVLRGKLKSPFRSTDFKAKEYDIGKEYHCENFDPNPYVGDGPGFYAVGLDGLLNVWGKGTSVFDVEVWGKSVEYNPWKRRYENIKIIKKVPKKTILERAKQKNLPYDLKEIMNPNKPDSTASLTQEHIKKAKKHMKTVKTITVHNVRKNQKGYIRPSTKTIHPMVVVQLTLNRYFSPHLKTSLRRHAELGAPPDLAQQQGMWAYIGSLINKDVDWVLVPGGIRGYPFRESAKLYQKGLFPFVNLGENNIGIFNMSGDKIWSMKEKNHETV